MAVAILEQERDDLLKLCETLERESGKGITKWHKSRHKPRFAYLRQVFADPRFKGTLAYSVFRHTTDYELTTLVTIVKAVHAREPVRRYTTLVYIDGLPKSKRHPWGAQLRKLGIPTRKVQGVAKDESNALIRLADATAGFVRLISSGGGDKEATALFKEAKQKGVLVEV